VYRQVIVPGIRGGAIVMDDPSLVMAAWTRMSDAV
jgi:hypothetical protein